MFIILLAVAAGAFLVYRVGMEASLTALPRMKVGDIVEEIQNHPNPDAATLNRAAQALTDNGYHRTAEVMRDRADIAHGVESVSLALPSTIEGVTEDKWRAFVNLHIGKSVAEISTAYQFGLFNIGYRRLADLGLATGVHRGVYKGKSVWLGKFISPLTLERFLSDPTLQYAVFCRDMVDRYKLVTSTHQSAIGEPLEGVVTSLSGLLTVAKLAGSAGLATWLTDPLERQRFSQTTAAFRAANGIF